MASNQIFPYKTDKKSYKYIGQVYMGNIVANKPDFEQQFNKVVKSLSIIYAWGFYNIKVLPSTMSTERAIAIMTCQDNQKHPDVINRLDGLHFYGMPIICRPNGFTNDSANTRVDTDYNFQRYEVKWFHENYVFQFKLETVKEDENYIRLSSSASSTVEDVKKDSSASKSVGKSSKRKTDESRATPSISHSVSRELNPTKKPNAESKSESKRVESAEPKELKVVNEQPVQSETTVKTDVASKVTSVVASVTANVVTNGETAAQTDASTACSSRTIIGKVDEEIQTEHEFVQSEKVDEETQTEDNVVQNANNWRRFKTVIKQLMEESPRKGGGEP